VAILGTAHELIADSHSFGDMTSHTGDSADDARSPTASKYYQRKFFDMTTAEKRQTMFVGVENNRDCPYSLY